MLRHEPHVGHSVTRLNADELRQAYLTRRALETEVLLGLPRLDPAALREPTAINTRIAEEVGGGAAARGGATVPEVLDPLADAALSPAPHEDHDTITTGDTRCPDATDRDRGTHAGAVTDEPQGSPAAPTAAVPAPAGAWATIKRTLVRAWDDDIFSESAAAAFWQTLSLPPLLLGLLGSLGYVGAWFAPNTLELVQNEIVRFAGGLFSRNAVDEIIAPTVDSILSTGRGELVSLGFLISLWSGSSALSSFVDAITRAHDQYGVRNPIWQRTIALLLYLIGLVAGIVALPLLALGPDRVTRLLPAALRDDATSLIGWLYYPVLGLVLMVALTTLYRTALPAKPPWRRCLPGALLAAVVFLVGVTGLRIYLNWITGTGYTYGALAAPIAFLLAVFFIGFAVVIGAHFNASIQYFHPARLKDRRGAVPQPPAEEPATVAVGPGTTTLDGGEPSPAPRADAEPPRNGNGNGNGSTARPGRDGVRPRPVVAPRPE